MDSKSHNKRDGGWIRFLLQSIALLMCLGFLLWRTSENLSSMVGNLSRMSPRTLVGALGILAAGFLLFPVGFCLLSRGRNDPVTYRAASRTFFGSLLLSYVPGGIWGWLSRVWILRDEGFGVTVSAPLLLLLPSSLVTAGSIVGFTAYSGGSDAGGVRTLFFVLGILVSLSTLAGFVFLPECFSQGIGTDTWWKQSCSFLCSMSMIERARNVLLTLLAYVLLWGVAGVSFHLVLTELDPAWGLGQLPLSVGTFALSWVTGLVVLVAPGGLGVREGAMLMLLMPWFPEAQALTAALISRTLWLGCEILFGLGIWVLYWLRGGTLARPHSPG